MKLILIIASILLLVMGAKVLTNKNLNRKKGKIFVGIGLLLLLLTQAFVVIPTGCTGVKTTFSQIDDTTVQKGWNWKVPFVQQIKLVNNKQQDKVFEDKIWSETQNRTAVYYKDVTVTYQINAEKSAWVYINVNDFEENLISQPLVASAIKSASKTLTDENATNRSQIEPLAAQMIQKSLDEKYDENVVIINKVIINDADFENSYNEAIAEAQKAVIEASKQATINEQKIAEAEAEKQAKVIKAEGEAEAIKIKAEAEAEANKKISESLTNNILQRTFYEKWDGVMPKVLGSNSSIMDVTSLLSDESKVINSYSE